MAEKVEENGVSVDNIYKFSGRHSWALDFYNKRPVQIASLDELADKKDFWVYSDTNGLEELKASGFDWDKQITVDQFRITRLQVKFLEPSTRGKKLNKMHLVHIY